MTADQQPALRRTAAPLALIGSAIGGPQAIAGKLGRLARTARLWLDRAEIERRLAALERRGYIRARPTRLQILFGGLDMLRFVIEPAARDYYRQQGIGFGFHQLLRILDDPVSMIDPTGFLSDRDTRSSGGTRQVRWPSTIDRARGDHWSRGERSCVITEVRGVRRVWSGSTPWPGAGRSVR